MKPFSIVSAAAAAALISACPATAQVLEPGAQAFVDAAAKAPPLYNLSHADARQVLVAVQADRIPSAATVVQDAVWPVGPTGKVRVRIVRPQGATGRLPVVIYLHGGGWVMGDRNTQASRRGLPASTSGPGKT